MRLTKIRSGKRTAHSRIYPKDINRELVWHRQSLGFPEIIILDEPTVGLDPKQIIEIRELIRDVGKETYGNFKFPHSGGNP